MFTHVQQWCFMVVYGILWHLGPMFTNANVHQSSPICSPNKMLLLGLIQFSGTQKKHSAQQRREMVQPLCPTASTSRGDDFFDKETMQGLVSIWIWRINAGYSSVLEIDAGHSSRQKSRHPNQVDGVKSRWSIPQISHVLDVAPRCIWYIYIYAMH